MAKIASFPIKKDTDYWGRVAQAAVTDEGAFTELYEHFFPRVYKFLLNRTLDSTLADELVSDTFLRCFQHLRIMTRSGGPSLPGFSALPRTT